METRTVPIQGELSDTILVTGLAHCLSHGKYATLCCLIQWYIYTHPYKLILKFLNPYRLILITLLASKDLFLKILCETFRSHLFQRLKTHFLAGKGNERQSQSRGMKMFGDGPWGVPHENCAWPLAPQTLTSPDGDRRTKSPRSETTSCKDWNSQYFTVTALFQGETLRLKRNGGLVFSLP